MNNNHRYCHQCGTLLNENVLFCPQCGIEQNTQKLSIRQRLEGYNIKKVFVTAFLCTSVILNVLFMPWQWINPKGYSRTVYSTIFYIPKELAKHPGRITYDYGRIMIEELILGCVFYAGYLIFTIKK